MKTSGLDAWQVLVLRAMRIRLLRLYNAGNAKRGYLAGMSIYVSIAHRAEC